MTDFARLERHFGHQVLARVDTENGSPCVVVRCDVTFTTEVTYGPYDDSDDGWDSAEKMLNEIDLESFAKQAIKLHNQMAGKEG